MGLTPKQERFAQLVAGGTNQSDAYRKAYDAKRMKAATVHRNAAALMRNNKIATRVAEIKEPVIEKMRYGLEDAMREAEQARRLALADPKGAGAAVSAVTLKAKLNGLLVERQEAGRPGEFANQSDADLEAQAKQVLAKAVKSGLVRILPKIVQRNQGAESPESRGDTSVDDAAHKKDSSSR